MIINKPGWNNQFNNINRHWYNRPNRPFHGGWWGGHVRPPVWHPWRRPGWGRWHWWAPVTVGAVTGWFVGASWGTPCYYNYGTGGNVYYEGDTVYIEGDEYCSTTEYYQEAEQIATAVPQYTEQQAEELEWMPLGVWAVTQDDVTDSNRLMQLAVNREGVIAGTYYNETTDTSVPIEGSVDGETQRAAWRLMDEKNSDVVMETGVYNLTNDVTSALRNADEDDLDLVKALSGVRVALMLNLESAP